MNFRQIQQCLCNHEQRIEELEEGESGIPDAPEDGNTYGREDGEWVQISDTVVTIGSAGEIPFVNTTSDDLDYSDLFYFDGVGVTIDSGSGTQSYVTDDSFQLRQSSNSASIVSDSINANRTHTLQNRSGVLAHLDQINEPAIIDSTTSRSLVAGSEFRTIAFTNGSAITATIPNDTTHNHAVGTQISLIQSGAGLLTVDTESPATVNGVTSVDSQGQYKGILLVKIAANTWTSVGNV